VQHSQEEIKSKPRDLKEFLALAHERFRKSAEASAEVRKDALEDLKFSVGQNHWPQDIEKRRQEEGKPTVTVNRLDQHIKLVGNEQRQQRPALKVNPVGDGATKDTAEVLQGVIRHIEVNSDAEVAYDESHDGMLRKGFDYLRVLTEFVDEESESNLDQEITIDYIKDGFRVYFDPTCNKHDYSDAGYAFVVEIMTPAAYRDKYPDSELATLGDFTSTGDADPDWANSEDVRVAEYFYVEKEYKTVTAKGGRQKKVTRRKVKWAKINAVEILEETEWAGKWIPIIPVLGTDKIIDGKRYLAGLVRNAKGAQRSYNYGISSAWEVAGIAPKAPYIADYRTVAAFATMWEQANRRNLSVLYYDSTPEAHQGEPLPPPQRNAVAPDLAAYAALIKQADYDLKASLGMFDPSLGQNKADQSGRAIQSLQKQGDLATLNYADNLSRSMRHLGRILVDLIPKVYDVARVMRIIQPDGSVDHVGVFNGEASGMSADEARQLPELAKVKKIYDLGVGSYDVTVSVGPSFQTKRQEAVATQLELLSSVPAVQTAAPDIVIRNMDIPNADAIADRIKKLLPQALQDDPGDDPKAQLAQAQAQLMQLGQQHQQLQQAAQEMKQTIDAKQVEAASKEKIAEMDGKIKLTIAEVTTKSQESQTRMQMEKEVWVEMHGEAHAFASMTVQHGHEKDMAERSATLAAENEQSDSMNQGPPQAPDAGA
jgi:hypothetical protein